MATINGSTNNSYYIIWLDAYESSYSIPNNTSTVVVKLYMKRTTGSYAYNGGSYSGTITVNGSSQSYSGSLPYPSAFNEGQSRLYATLTFSNIPHNADGTKTVSISATYGADFSPTSGSASGTLTLSTIPRASKITATSAYILETSDRVQGVSQLTVTRYSTSFTHTIQYSFGNDSGYILADGSTTSTATKITSTSIGFPIPSTWFAQIPNDKQGTCTLTIKTYNGSTQIGSNQTTTFVVKTDQAASEPIVTSSVIDTNATTLALTGNDTSILIKGYSTAQVTWSATAQDSSAISNVSINGTTVTTSPYSFTLTNDYVDVIATDSRGYPKTNHPVFTLKNYNDPLFTLAIERVAPTSDYANMTFSGTWFNDYFGNGGDEFTIGDTLGYSNTFISMPNNLYLQMGTTDTTSTFITTGQYKVIYEVENSSTTRAYTVWLMDLTEPVSTQLVLYYGVETISNGNFELYQNASDLTVNYNFGTIATIDTNNLLYGFFHNTNNGQSTKNTLTLYWKYKKTTDSVWTTGGTLVNGTDYTISGSTFYSGTSSSPGAIQIGGSLDYAYAWDIILYAEDELATYSVSQTMTQGIPIVNWTDTYFNINGELRINNTPVTF